MLCWFQVYSKVTQSHLQMYPHGFRFFPVWAIAEYSVEVPVPYSRLSGCWFGKCPQGS